MAKDRKKPCRICRRWFRPDARVGERQRACGKPECQAARRQKTQADWRKRNPDYAHRLEIRPARRANTTAGAAPDSGSLEPTPLGARERPVRFTGDRFHEGYERITAACRERPDPPVCR